MRCEIRMRFRDSRSLIFGSAEIRMSLRKVEKGLISGLMRFDDCADFSIKVSRE
jgi:hypothetical protein